MGNTKIKSVCCIALHLLTTSKVKLCQSVKAFCLGLPVGRKDEELGSTFVCCVSIRIVLRNDLQLITNEAN